jgi:hypothetical protein
MLVSKNSRCVGLVASALLFSILLAPTVLVAQDGKPTKFDAYYKAIWVKLEAAVAAGKLTKEDALKKMEAIKKAAGEKNNLKSGVDKKSAFPKGDAVKKGEVKKGVDKKGAANKNDLKKGVDKKSAFPKGDAVKKGDFKKDAYSKGNAVKKGNDAVVGLHLETVWIGLRGLVAAGKMSQQEAEAIIGGIKKRTTGGKDVKRTSRTPRK